MLVYVLALAVGLGSLVVYMAAFFFPEVHRKGDFIWSGIGLFYALVLWVCAGRITGGVLLGQIAGVVLLGWSVGQTLSLRRQLTPRSAQTEVPSAKEVKTTVGEKVAKLSLPQRLSQFGKQVTGSASAAKNRLQKNLSKAKDVTAATATSRSKNEPPIEVIDKRTLIAEQSASKPTTTDLTTELVPRESTQIKVVPLGAEPPVITKDPAGPDMPGLSGKEVIPVEAIAPEVELAPPAEPRGLGDPEDRQNLSPSSSSEQQAELIRPHPPDPEIVEAAIRDAEEKHLEASPPEVEPENPSPS